MEDYWKKASDWYNFSNPMEAYTGMITRWGAMMAAYSKAMASLFEMAAKYQEEATRDMARMGKDPMAAMDVYWAALGRKMEMWNELYPIMQRMQQDADLMYERLRREADAGGASESAAGAGSGTGAYGSSGSGGFRRPGMRYGSAAAEGARAAGEGSTRSAGSGYGAATDGPSGAGQPGGTGRPEGGYRRVAKVKP